MMVMKIRCTSCGSKKFVYTSQASHEGFQHGAICADCQKPLTFRDLLPLTDMIPVNKNAMGLRQTGS